MDENWKKALISSGDTIESSLQAIDAGGLRIALVTDDKGVLVGTLSDGDVRRALIDRIPLTEPVSRIMNQRPRVAHAGDGPLSIRAMMERNDLLVVPLVDSDGRVVGVHHLRQMIEAAHRDNAVFLMAGGFGKRLSPLTDDCPKPMLKIGGKPILETTLENFISAGFRKFFISVHYLPEVVKNHFQDGKRWGAEIQYIEEKTPLGTAGAIGLLPPGNGKPIIMMNGDLVTRVDFNALLAEHVAQDATFTMCVREHHLQVPYGVVQSEGGAIQDVVEKPTHKFFVNAGIYVFSSEVQKSVAPQERIDMPDLVRRIVAAGHKAAMFPIHEYWLDVGRFDDFHQAIRDQG